MAYKNFPQTFLYLWTGAVAVVTVISAILSLGEGIGISSGLPVTSDIPGGCILLLNGVILMTGVVEGRADRARWVQYGYIGLLLLLIFGSCTVLISGANSISMLIEGKSPDLLPLFGSGFVWAGILAIPAYPGVRKILFAAHREVYCNE